MCVRFDKKMYRIHKGMRVPSTETDCHLKGNKYKYIRGSYLLNRNDLTLHLSDISFSGIDFHGLQ